ncbi:fibronectin type III domain-containing protein [Corynebacterium felinum]|uniref:Fibronectin type-III domain-containing protein n=1 Tax=Corynebacterium felinum TaxID=131318 RepID=A0ABU2BCT3_9CORY|nr:fibronectin type III domain-containing protein [Corynebacterium felinum]MDF5821275.1 fibronectin type III domain-containing protein [Corynebacterium felinum]MDR7355204.1 hypothetical protein [Corynebacterium felinum]WJY94555.1 Fibronectin type III domain protein [Corynebacterium felinum]
MHAPKWRRALIASATGVSMLLATPGMNALAQPDVSSQDETPVSDSSSVGVETENAVSADPAPATTGDEEDAESAENSNTEAEAATSTEKAADTPAAEEENEDSTATLVREAFVRVDGSTVVAWWAPVEDANHYTVKLLNAQNNAQVGEASHTVHNTEYIHNVPAGTYKVEVTAWTNDSQVNTPFYSQSLTVTNERTKPAQPNAPFVEFIGGNQARVQWYRNSNGGLPILHSTVTLTPTDSTDPIVVKVDGDEERATVSGLVVGKTYKATVVATNAAGSSEPSEASAEIVASEDPRDLQLSATPHLIDSTVNNEITVTGSGYTGGAVKDGLYIVVWDTNKWVPGSRPSASSSAHSLSFEVKPNEINNGSFTKTITIPANTLLLNRGIEYQIGTVAGGTAVATDRRADKAVPLSLRAQPVTSVHAVPSDKNKVTVTWGRPTDSRATSYRIKLYDASVTPYKYVDQKDLGYQLGRAEFFDVKPGNYIVGVSADISTTFWDSKYSQEVFSRPFVVEKEKAILPSVPARPHLQAGAVPGSLTVSWVDVNSGRADRASSYTIVFSNGTETRVEKAGQEDSQLTFTGFGPGSWTATVTAHNAAGASAPSEPTAAVVIAKPPVVRNLNLKVSQDLIDTKKASTVTVTGSGYTDTDTIKLAIVPAELETPKLLETDVQVVNGQFTHKLQIPANTLDPTKKYTVLSFKGDEYKERALLKLADPAVAKPQLIADNTIVFADRETKISVTGSGYVGDGAANGTYVFVYDTSTWKPGTLLNTTTKLAAQVHVNSARIRDGRFSTALSIPAGALEKGKKYAIGTSAAHALSQTDRTLDFSLPLTVQFPEVKPSVVPSAQPSVTPSKPAEPSAQPSVTPSKPAEPSAQPSATPSKPAEPSAQAPKPSTPAEPKPSAEAPKPSAQAPKPSAAPSSQTPKPSQAPSTTSQKPSTSPSSTSQKPAEPTEKPSASPWVIVASVLGVVAAIAAALGAVAALFPEAVNMLKSRLGF